MSINISIFILSIALSAGRNITTKSTALKSVTSLPFYLSQAILFLSAAVLLAVSACFEKFSVSPVTLVYGIIYGALLIISQWFFTVSLRYKSTSVCTVLYSLGFIIPTVFGTFYFNESLGYNDIIGILVAICIVILNFKHEEDGTSKQNKKFIPFILLAMVGSGGLGIMQKIQQNSQYYHEKSVFLIIAFVFAFLCSLIAHFLKGEKPELNIKNFATPSICGLCFGGANLCNTLLAGRMKSSVFFPLQNITTILVTALLGIIIFKEKMNIKTAVMIVLTAAVIILFNL